MSEDKKAIIWQDLHKDGYIDILILVYPLLKFSFKDKIRTVLVAIIS
jgi:hypothetical protein